MSEEELLERAAEERAAIVTRYQLGRQEGAPQVDAWEDPEFKIYQVTDRYGFIHDQEVLERSDPAAVRVELEREKKWVKMLRQWQSKSTGDKLRRRVFKGIPNALRGEAWSKMLNLATVKEEQGDKKYQEMRNLAWKWSTDIRQIDLDVNRTYRDHIFFRQRYNSKQQQLFNVLGAYSVYNVEIGYCQGMSQIAALLLMYLEEEDAFWALSRLVSDTKYCMHGFFIHGFPKLLRYQEHHDKIMNKFLPKLKKHLDRNGVDTGIYTLKWFFQCFLDRIPFKLTLRVWDVYLLEGERVLTAMAYNLLKLHRRNLMQLGMDDILQFLQVRLEKKFDFDEDHTMDSLQKCMDELKKAKLDYPGPPPQNELPKQPFGTFKEPAFEQKVGHRSSEFSNVERSTRASVIMRRDAAAAAAAATADEEEGGGRDTPPTPTAMGTPTPSSAATANGHAVPPHQRHSAHGSSDANATGPGFRSLPRQFAYRPSHYRRYEDGLRDCDLPSIQFCSITKERRSKEDQHFKRSNKLPDITTFEAERDSKSYRSSNRRQNTFEQTMLNRRSTSNSIRNSGHFDRNTYYKRSSNLHSNTAKQVSDVQCEFNRHSTREITSKMRVYIDID